MARKVVGVVKLQLNAGKATPAPPVGPALGGYGINMMEFIKGYNEKTAPMIGIVVPVEITIYDDRSFQFITKTPPAADLLKKAAGVPERFRDAQQDQGRQDQPAAAARDRHDQDARPERQRRGRRHEDHRRHRPLDGH